MVPFEEREEALWAIRITAGDGTLDLFGLGMPFRQGEERVYKMGELRYDLQGHGTSLFNLVARAERWWAKFRGKKITGRPRGSGTWASADELRKALNTAVRTLRAEGRKVTQESVADHWWTDDRTLRKWMNHFGVRWEDVKKTS